MTDKVYKMIQLVGTSSKSFSDATSLAIAKANESLRNLDWFEVVENRGTISNGKVSQYQVTLKVGFRLD